MAILFLSLLAVLLLLASFAFFLGFRLGGDHWESELTRVRMESVQAERQLHDLTRHAFIAMAEQVELHRQPEPETIDEDDS